MNAQIINGRSLQHLFASPALEAAAASGLQLRISMLSVDSDEPSLQFCRDMYSEAFAAHHIDYEDCRFPAGATLDDVLGIVEGRNNSSRVHGILALTPLPQGIPMKKILAMINPEKEMEGLHPEHIISLFTGEHGKGPDQFPLVGEAILRTLENLKVDTKGRGVAILMEEAHMLRNPVAHLAARCAAPVMLPVSSPVSFVSVDHPEAWRITSAADILIIITERFGVVGADWVKPGATIIDFNPSLIGFEETEDDEAQPLFSGAVMTEEVDSVAGRVFLVQGGLRPVALGLLMRNLATAAVNRHRAAAGKILALNQA